jgi:hypothetical protein
MSTLSSIKLCLVTVSLASSAIVGCGGPEAREASAVRFAMGSRAAFERTAVRARVVATDVVSERVDLRQPLLVREAGKRVEITFGLRQREGATHRIDPASLATTAVTTFTFDEMPHRNNAYYLRTDSANVTLDAGRSIAFSTDMNEGRVHANIDGSEVVISEPGVIVMGPPRAAAVDKSHVVVAYYATTYGGCALIASMVEVTE